MIDKFAEFIVQKLICNCEIEKDEQNLYHYALFILISKILFFTFTLALGLLLNAAIESLIFFIAFIALRQYAGGFHAKTETRCEVLSFCSLFGCILIIKLAKIYDMLIPMLCTALFFSAIIFIFAPIDSLAKPLSKKEFKYYRKVSLTILLCILIAIIVSFCFKLNIVFAPCCVSIILEGVLVGVGQIKKTCTKKRASSDI